MTLTAVKIVAQGHPVTTDEGGVLQPGDSAIVEETDRVKDQAASGLIVILPVQPEKPKGNSSKQFNPPPPPPESKEDQ